MEGRVAVVADCHLWNHRAHGGQLVGGLNQRARQGLAVLRAAVQRAEALGCELFLIAGDIFDGARPEPQLVRATQEALETKMSVVVVMGNHDLISTQPGDHTLGPLDPVAAVVAQPAAFHVGAGVLLCIPFQSGPAREWFPVALEKLVAESGAASSRVLVTHLGLAGHESPVFLREGDDVLPTLFFGGLLAKHGIKLGLAGNWHGYYEHHYADPTFTEGVQIGALVPTGWDNPGIDGLGSLVIVNMGPPVTYTREVIPGPRFLKMRWGDAPTQVQAAHTTANVVYLRIEAKPEDVAAAHAWLSCQPVVGEVVLDDLMVRVAARTAATVARSAETLAEALAGYVEQMPLAEGVDRKAVLGRAQKFLGG